VGETGTADAVERVSALDPDLVLLDTDLRVPAGRRLIAR
jgi:CheY-like chemotaxis protein